MSNKQLFCVLPAQSRPMDLLPSNMIDQIENDRQALSLMVTLSGLTHESIANEINKPRETVTRFLNGNGGLDLVSLTNLINASGNLVLLQAMAKKFGYELKPVDKVAKRKAELLAELQSLENAA